MSATAVLIFDQKNKENETANRYEVVHCINHGLPKKRPLVFKITSKLMDDATNFKEASITVSDEDLENHTFLLQSWLRISKYRMDAIEEVTRNFLKLDGKLTFRHGP